jgi:sensor histidine kinase YesM
VVTVSITLANVVHAQKTQQIPICTNCLDSLLTAFWTPPQSAKIYVRDTVTQKFDHQSTKSKEVLIFVGNPDFCEVKVNHKLYYGGRYQAKRLLSSGSRFFIPISLKSGLNTISLTAHSITDDAFFVQPTLLDNVNKLAVEQAFADNNSLSLIITLIFLTVLSVLLVYSLLHYLLYHNLEYKYYGMYVGYVWCYNLFCYDWFSENHWLFPDFPLHYAAIENVSQQLIVFFYLQFVLHFLDLKKVDPLSFRLIQLVRYFLLATGLFLAAYQYFTYNSQVIAQKLSVLFIVPFVLGFYLFYRIWKKAVTPLRYYILLGGLVVNISFIGELLFSNLPNIIYYRNYFTKSFNDIHSFNVSQIGITVELFFFLLAIAMRTRSNELQRIRLKNTTIQQLQENRKLEVQVKDLLEERLTQSEKALEIEKLNSEKQKTESNLLKAQMKSLQLQMNPHYLFNSLNSINDFIISQNPMEASEYLALYARMMRKVLKSSDKMFNTLDEELSFCADYLELEKLRFGNKFNFEIKRPSDPKRLKVMVPAMLLQPVLENAVWHGMMHIKTDGKIVLDASKQTAQRTHICISDNGNGLPSGNNDRIEKRQSYGIRNIKEKMILIEKMYGKETRFEINNRTDSSGVEVRFEFPIFEEVTEELNS